ncbi:hypothetical protein HanRHA438_Chr09g0378711 [Helianthus annuus]|uniref:Cysteine-rich transmembrane CYSTM domain-containing protein n=1 Tax=Helianthus annuus TaxID=4232 RepID=A0A251TRE7_HELAN|nr:annexin A7 [Helianthus annuus]KAF5789147.1 hypothetical protein HanXRQr2_Chr09g0367561 [Helianthus annuus]KAJ0886383.1 hypothetical protein HanRHA438_Chr09g0378711 [Helianthus annuus]KAJ0891459.1 hypothetical protein HanPSC8_Chr09g0354021 [Helianthus annuus]
MSYNNQSQTPPPPPPEGYPPVHPPQGYPPKHGSHPAPEYAPKQQQQQRGIGPQEVKAASCCLHVTCVCIEVLQHCLRP